ncbi:MAG: [FeFe] hydrogenase H-cluster maturation GTPase HydF [Bacteroidales bacterium]|nr:[FeFe] hydrogenase H-cluster maturation GTPase HydF [Bacteroidales bacterium]
MKQGKDNKPHIGIYGRRNAGKSSLINCLSGQNISIVSDLKGTTTDPVKRSYEILGYAPVIFIDTAGIDDEGETGQLRIQRSLETLNIIDIAIIVISDNEFGDYERKIIERLKELKTVFFIIHNKSDIAPLDSKLKQSLEAEYKVPVIDFTTTNRDMVPLVFDTIKQIAPESTWTFGSLLGDIVGENDMVLLITPIDSEAPQGRMILPQVQVLRDCLDNHCIVITVQDTEVEEFFRRGIKPRLAVTDSQVFHKVKNLIPSDVPLTSFSIVLARSKGDFANYLKGTPHIADLRDGDRILMLESCSHHVSCEDIGRVKIPNALRKFTGKNLEFTFVAGLDQIPDKITDYAMLIQCGGCMVTRKQLLNRLKPAVDAGIPISNYGMTLAYLTGIFDKAVEIFK